MSVDDFDFVEFGDDLIVVGRSAATNSAKSFWFALDLDALEERVLLVDRDAVGPGLIGNVLGQLIDVRFVDVRQFGGIGRTTAPALKDDWTTDANRLRNGNTRAFGFCEAELYEEGCGGEEGEMGGGKYCLSILVL